MAKVNFKKYPKTNEWLERIILQEPIDKKLTERVRQAAVKTHDWIDRQHR